MKPSRAGAKSPLGRCPAEVFLSHSSNDRTVATEIAELLRRHGVRVWYSETHIRGAQQWHDEIGKALGRCDWFVLLLTPHAVKSMWVKNELLFALNERRFRNRIVPIMLRKCRPALLSWTLGAIEHVQATSDFQSGCRDLLRIWGIELRA